MRAYLQSLGKEWFATKYARNSLSCHLFDREIDFHRDAVVQAGEPSSMVVVVHVFGDLCAGINGVLSSGTIGYFRRYI